MDYGDKPAAAKRSLLTPPRWSLFAQPLTPSGETAEIGFISGGFGTLPSVSAQITGGREFAGGQQEIRLRFAAESAQELSVIVRAMHSRSQSWQSFQSRRTTSNNILRQVAVITGHGFQSGLVHFVKLFSPKAV